MARMGRPPKRDDEKRGVAINFRTTKALHDRLETAREDRTLSAEIDLRLRRSFEADPMEAHFGPARVSQVHGILEDLRTIESFGGAHWHETRFVWDECKAYLETFFAHLAKPEGRRTVPEPLSLYRKFSPGFFGNGLALTRLAQLHAQQKNDPPHNPVQIDPEILRLAFARKTKAPAKRRTK